MQTLESKTYTLTAQLLHWAMAGILIYLILFSGFEEMSDPEVLENIPFHALLGLTILILGLIRWVWRLLNPPPEDQESSVWQLRWAKRMHLAFYALFFIIPVLGVILAGLVNYEVNVYGVFELSSWLKDDPEAAKLTNSLHGFATDVMTALLIIHVAAALYKQFYQGKSTLSRMLPWSRDKT